jgi:hypothetical protein
MSRYRMTPQEYSDLAEASRPQPYIWIGNRPPSDPQDWINRVWQRVCDRLGVDITTVSDVDRVTGEFSAVPMRLPRAAFGEDVSWEAPHE